MTNVVPLTPNLADAYTARRNAFKYLGRCMRAYAAAPNTTTLVALNRAEREAEAARQGLRKARLEAGENP